MCAGRKVLTSTRSLSNASPSFKKEKTHAKRMDNLVWPYVPQSKLLCRSGMGKRAWLLDVGRSNTSHVGCVRDRCRSGHLDRCEEQLSSCYESCKPKRVSPKLCSNSCTTD